MLRRLIRRIERLLATRQTYKFFLRSFEPLLEVEACADTLQALRLNKRLEPVVMPGPVKGPIVVVAPHPDDDIFGCGGTLIEARKQGHAVHVIYVTSGKPAEQLEQEVAENAAEFGFDLTFMRQPLNRIAIDAASTAELRGHLERIRPGCLFLPSFVDDHDDHRRAGELVLAALADSSDFDALEIWAYQVYTLVPTNVIVDVTDNMPARSRAIGRFHSQAGSRDWDHWVSGRSAFLSRYLSTGGAPRHAEAFLVLPWRDYRPLLERYHAHHAACYELPFYTNQGAASAAS